MKSRISIYTLFTLATLGTPTMLLAQEGAAPKTAEAQPAKVEPPKENALEGELRLDGKITVVLGPGQWVVEAVSWTSPKGVTTNFDDPKNKNVLLNSDAFLHPHAEYEKVPLDEVKVGSRVAVIGKNQPDGTLKVREVVLLEGYGAHKKVGSLRTNAETSRLIRQSREARDLGQINRAIELAKRAAEIAQGMGDMSGEALASQDVGNLYIQEEKYEEAMSYYTREETLGKALSNPLPITFGKLGRASVMVSTDQTEDAIPVLQEAIPFSLSTPATLQIDVLDLLSMSYVALGQSGEAIGIMEKLYPLQAGNGQGDGSVKTRAYIALLRAADEPDAARTVLDQIAGNVPRIANDGIRGNTQGIVGLTLWRMGEKEAAAEQFQTAIKTFKDSGAKGGTRWEKAAKKLAELGDKNEDPLNLVNPNDNAPEDRDAPPDGPTA